MIFFSMTKVSGRKNSVTTFRLPLTFISKSFHKLSTGTLNVGAGRWPRAAQRTRMSGSVMWARISAKMEGTFFASSMEAGHVWILVAGCSWAMLFLASCNSSALRDRMMMLAAPAAAKAATTTYGIADTLTAACDEDRLSLGR